MQGPTIKPHVLIQTLDSIKEIYNLYGHWFEKKKRTMLFSLANASNLLKLEEQFIKSIN